MPAKLPQDHKAPAEIEAKKEQFFTVEHDGETYTIDRQNADNLELMEFIEDEQYIKAIRGYVGRDQWAKFKDAHRDEQGRVSADQFEGFLNTVLGAIGGTKDDVPNSSASPTS